MASIGDDMQAPGKRSGAASPAARAGEPRAHTRAVAAIVLGLGLTALLLVLGIVQRVRALALVTGWSALTLVAFVGWGALVNRLAYGRARAGWSLQAAWGMALATVFGGALCAVSMASRSALLAFVAIGLLLFAWDASEVISDAVVKRAWTRLRAFPIPLALAVLSLLLLLGVQYVGAAAEYRLNLGDDLPAYAAYPRQILETGTLIAPFSIRRMMAYGGQSFLQAFVLLAGAERNLHLFDAGLCVVVLCGLVAQEAARLRRVSTWLVLPLVLMVLVLPGRRFNLAGWLSGAVFLFAAFRLLRWEPFATSRRPANAATLALLVAGACSLRNSYVVPALALGCASTALALAAPSPGPGDRRAVLREWLWHVGITLVLLAPWIIVAWRSNRTPLFPLIVGTASADSPFFPAGAPGVTGLDRVKTIWAALIRAETATTLPLIVIALAAIIARDGTERRALRATALATLAAVFAAVVRVPGGDPASLSRITFAAVVTLVLACAVTGLEILCDPERRRVPPQLAAGCIAALAIIFQISAQRIATKKTYDTHVDRIWEASKDKHQPWRDYWYQEMQSRVPVGAPIVSMVDDPRWFDFRRNPILMLDLPGGASPRPGLPLLRGPQAVIEYLRSLGYRYVACARPSGSKEAYRRSYWEKIGRQNWGRRFLPYYRAAFDLVDELAVRQQLLYEDSHMLLADLMEGAPERRGEDDGPTFGPHPEPAGSGPKWLPARPMRPPR